VSETTRFAPSPTGRLHLGHAFAAISAYESARQSGPEGRFLLRIEDLDQGRSRSEFTAAIYEDLAWLGITWEQPVMHQSTRTDAYRAALATLEQLELVYPCFCTRRDIADDIARAADAPHGLERRVANAIYPGTCRALSHVERDQRLREGQRYAMRLDSARAAARCGTLTLTELGEGPNGERGDLPVNPQLFGDVVLARKDLPAAYHLAVVVDDAFQNVTLVTRGLDLFTSTHVQRVLQRLLGLPVPRYAHHRLVLNETGRKFSKRNQAVTLRCLRDAGVSAAQILERVGAPAINKANPAPRHA
jgi:glutamyl-Q tRNA(Asp) synthetase